MPAMPFPLQGDFEEFRTQCLSLFRELYEERVGGADVGDVFAVNGDVLELQLSPTGGLQKSSNTVRIKLDGTSLSLSANGLRIALAGIVTAMLADLAVTEAKLGNLAVTEGKIGPLAVSEGKMANSAVSQLVLKTDFGTVSTTSESGENLTLPGGEYGFYPQVMWTKTAGTYGTITAQIASAVQPAMDTYVTNIFLVANIVNGGNTTAVALQRYITSSGHDPWIFLKVEKGTNRIISAYEAPDHPCANQRDATELVVKHPFNTYDPDAEDILVVDNEVLDTILPLTAKKNLLKFITQNCIVDDAVRPEYTSREIVKINENPDEPIGEVLKEMPVPEWARAMIGSDIITLERRMVESLPDGVLFKRLRVVE